MSTTNGIYRQKEGLAMGSPASPVLANLWLSQFEKYFQNGNTKLFKRYVDDILVVMDKGEIDNRMEVINKLHPNLKFTLELESEQGGLPFLDMCLRKVGDKISSEWYQKPANSGIILNFFALAPSRYKRSVVRSLVYRIFNSCSNWKLFHLSMKKAVLLLEKNQYPRWFYEKVIHDTLESLIKKTKPKDKLVLDEKVTGKRLAFFQFRGFQTLEFIKKLEKAEAPIVPILIMRKMKTILSNTKVPIEKFLSSNVIYELNCSGCNSRYIGLTQRHLITRKNEHCWKNGIMWKHLESCSLNHNREIEVNILAKSYRGLLHLSILEALFIREKSPTLNTKDEYIHRPLRIRI